MEDSIEVIIKELKEAKYLIRGQLAKPLTGIVKDSLSASGKIDNVIKQLNELYVERELEELKDAGLGKPFKLNQDGH